MKVYIKRTQIAQVGNQTRLQSPGELRDYISSTIPKRTWVAKQADLHLKHYRKTWGDKKSNPQRKEKGEPPKRELNEFEASSLSETEFRVMVIKMFKRLEDKCTQLNYTQLKENYKELNENVTKMKRNQEEMKNDIAAIKNTMESLKSRLEEAEDRIS